MEMCNKVGQTVPRFIHLPHCDSPTPPVKQQTANMTNTYKKHTTETKSIHMSGTSVNPALYKPAVHIGKTTDSAKRTGVSTNRSLTKEHLARDAGLCEIHEHSKAKVMQSQTCDDANGDRHPSSKRVEGGIKGDKKELTKLRNRKAAKKSHECQTEYLHRVQFGFSERGATIARLTTELV